MVFHSECAAFPPAPPPCLATTNNNLPGPTTHLAMPGRRRRRPIWCCGCRAAEASVIVDTAKQRQPSLARSASVVSLAYLDAVASETELPPPVVDLTPAGSLDDIFYDAEEGPPSEVLVVANQKDENHQQIKKPLSSNRDVVTFEMEPASIRHPLVDGHVDDDKYLLAPDYRDGSVSTMGVGGGSTARRRRRHTTGPGDKGFPGHLTPDQLRAVKELRKELKQKGNQNIYHEMVYSYKDLEPEAYALCRYLRLYHFHVKKVFAHMDRNADLWREAGRQNFYPSVVDAVGAPLSVLLTQFPSLYYGLSKQGYPCCYFNAGALSVEGIECVTDPSRLANFIWYTMMHDLKHHKFPEAKKRHPEFARLEQITILNLKGLSRSLFTPKMYHALQQVDTAAAVFPEMLHCLIVINAPGFFTFFWSIISRFIDPKTKNLVEIYSSPEKGEQRLLELIEKNELPRDYGGSAPSTSEIILREGRTDSVPHRQVVELLHVGKEQHVELFLEANERIALSIYTRSATPYVFCLSDTKGGVVHKQAINSPPAESVPSCFGFGESIRGPGKFTMTARASGHHSGKHYFLLIGEVFRT